MNSIDRPRSLWWDALNIPQCNCSLTGGNDGWFFLLMLINHIDDHTRALQDCDHTIDCDDQFFNNRHTHSLLFCIFVAEQLLYRCRSNQHQALHRHFSELVFIADCRRGGVYGTKRRKLFYLVVEQCRNITKLLCNDRFFACTRLN